MQKIVISHLSIGSEKIPAPVGLSELLEPYLSLNVDMSKIDEIASQYDFIDYKNEKDKWVTKCVRKNVITIENPTKTMADTIV